MTENLNFNLEVILKRPSRSHFIPIRIDFIVGFETNMLFDCEKRFLIKKE